MNTGALFIIFICLDIIICILISERANLKDRVTELTHETFDVGLENGRKDFALKMLKEEHKKEVKALNLKLAAYKKELDVVKTQNEALKVFIREQEKTVKQNSEATYDRA